MPRQFRFNGLALGAGLAAGVSVLGGCTATPAVPSQHEATAATFEPTLDGKALPVIRLALQASPERVPDLSEIALFSGRISDYHLGKIVRREPPATLLERQVPASIWRDAGTSQVWVAPERVLTPSETYTLAAPDLGRIVEFEVVDRTSAAAFPLLRRVWPPLDAAGGGFAVFCGVDAPSEPLALTLAPIGREAELTPGFGRRGDEACAAVRFDSRGLAGSVLVFPPEVAGYLVDPAPLVVAEAGELAPRACEAGSVVLGPGCAWVEDDRILLLNADAPLLWTLTVGEIVGLWALGSGARRVVHGFVPGTEQRVFGVAVTLSGTELSFDEMLATESPRARWVLNEVLSNPIGAEPSAEWIEIVNDGSAAGNLAGLELEDPGGRVVLPEATIASGEPVLLVRDDFVANAYDVPLLAGARAVRLPELGKNGLSNSGEPLTLRGPSGQVHSRFPAFSAVRAGVSIARRSPDAFDDDVTAFGEHAAPGASPGAPNHLADSEPSP